jgi:hypothetical protein
MLADLEELARDPGEFLRKLGGLHDARITTISWSSKEARLVMVLDDLYSNFEGLPEYEGRAPVSLIFEGVLRLALTIDPVTSNVSVFACEAARQTQGPITVVFRCSPGGLLEVTCKSLRGEPLSESS